jgi:hypothetical protein
MPAGQNAEAEPNRQANRQTLLDQQQKGAAAYLVAEKVREFTDCNVHDTMDAVLVCQLDDTQVQLLPVRAAQALPDCAVAAAAA